MKKVRFPIQQTIQFIKYYPFAIILIFGIWVVCLTPIPEVPLSSVTLIDKRTHVVLYIILGCCVWIETVRSRQRLNNKQLFILTLVIPIIMRGLIEIVQTTRIGGNHSGKWVDFLADSIGVVLSLLIGILLVTYLSKRKKGS